MLYKRNISMVMIGHCIVNICENILYFIYLILTPIYYFARQCRGVQRRVKGNRKLTLTWPEFSPEVVLVLNVVTPRVDVNTFNRKMSSRTNPSCKVTVGAGAVASKVFTMFTH